MVRRRLFHPEIGFRQSWVSACPLNRVESFLLFITVFALLFVAGIWLRDAIVGGPPPVMAGITVQAGDTLWTLAEEYGDPNEYILERVNALAKANNLEQGEVLHEGQVLVIPVANTSAKLYYGGKYASRQIAD